MRSLPGSSSMAACDTSTAGASVSSADRIARAPLPFALCRDLSVKRYVSHAANDFQRSTFSTERDARSIRAVSASSAPRSAHTTPLGSHRSLPRRFGRIVESGDSPPSCAITESGAARLRTGWSSSAEDDARTVRMTGAWQLSTSITEMERTKRSRSVDSRVVGRSSLPRSRNVSCFVRAAIVCGIQRTRARQVILLSAIVRGTRSGPSL
jgi:hypothetical protein